MENLRAEVILNNKLLCEVCGWYNERMKKYRQRFPKTAFVVYCVMNVVSMVAIVFAALKLAGVGNFASYFPFVDITTIVIFVFFLVFTAILLFNSSYSFGERTFVIRHGFSKQVIDRDAIARFIYDEPSGAAALYYVNPLAPDAAMYVVVVIRKKDMDDFIADLRALKSDIVIEVNSAPPSVEG